MKTVTFFLWASVTLASAQNDIIIDNQHAVFKGKWDVSKTATDHHGDDYRSTACVAGEATATATFRPEIGIAGKYNVEVMFPHGDDHSRRAPWEISCLDGTFTTNINQTVDGGKWVRIASGLNFEAGTKGFVQLSNGTEENDSSGKTVVIADAVRFVRTGKASATTASTTTTSAKSSSSAKKQSTPKPTAKSSEPKPIESKPAPASVTGWRFSMQTSVTGNGTVLKDPDQPGYSDRDVITLTAKPDKGNVFVGWSGNASGLENPLKFTVTDSATVTAEFLPEAIGVILESSEAELTGRWSTNSQKWTGQRSESYAFTAATTDEEASVLYRPSLPKPGKYDVYIYFLQGDNRATKTVWEVSGRGGSFNVVVDQRQNGRAWYQIATAKPFDAGSAGYVRLTSKAEPIPSVVVADSIAFVYTGPLDSR